MGPAVDSNTAIPICGLSCCDESSRNDRRLDVPSNIYKVLIFDLVASANRNLHLDNTNERRRYSTKNTSLSIDLDYDSGSGYLYGIRSGVLEREEVVWNLLISKRAPLLLKQESSNPKTAFDDTYRCCISNIWDQGYLGERIYALMDTVIAQYTWS